MPRPKQGATLKDIARATELSIATVSIILSSPDRNRFSSEVNKRVQEYAKKLDYKPLKAKARNHINMIGLIIPDINNMFYSEIASGFSRLANKLGYQVMLLDTANDFEKEKKFFETLMHMNITGVGLCGAAIKYEKEELELIKSIWNQGIPVVQFDRYTVSSPYPYVGIDNYRAGCCMTEKLISEGHKNIAVLISNVPSFNVCERLRGCSDTLKEYGYQADVFEYEFERFGSVFQQFNQIVNDDKPYSVIFTVNGDIDAIECVKAADTMGVRIPEDISIAGFDDIRMAAIINPPLTTISQPRFEIGETAVRLLDAMINKNILEEENIILPFEYKVRGSTANLCIK